MSPYYLHFWKKLSWGQQKHNELTLDALSNAETYIFCMDKLYNTHCTLTSVDPTIDVTLQQAQSNLKKIILETTHTVFYRLEIRE